jgi:hypothetical protein
MHLCENTGCPANGKRSIGFGLNDEVRDWNIRITEATGEPFLECGYALWVAWGVNDHIVGSSLDDDRCEGSLLQRVDVAGINLSWRDFPNEVLAQGAQCGPHTQAFSMAEAFGVVGPGFKYFCCIIIASQEAPHNQRAQNTTSSGLI